MSKRTIRITGEGKASVAPDTIRLDMYMLCDDYNYDEVIKKSEKSLDSLREVLKDEGFNKEDIKTNRFDIVTVYDTKKNEDDEYVRYFVGYRVSNDIYIEIEQSPEKLGRVLKKISKSYNPPEISIEYKLKDYKEMRNKILKNAIIDAREKAQLISQASGLKLGEIINIDYSWNEIEVTNRHSLVLDTEMMYKSESILDIQPDDISDLDSISIIWEVH